MCARQCFLRFSSILNFGETDFSKVLIMTKVRNAANRPFDPFCSINGRILKECHQIYTDTDNGLVSMGQDLGFKLLPPRKKITIMLIGNHSAGKSSFINWYVEEHIQKTGVAIETQGFSFITSGRKRESLTGNATLHLYPHYKPLTEIPGLIDYIQTEVSTSKQKKFPLISFIDTPGLVDGDMKYPFDVNRALLWLGDLVDLIFVFFDPIGQALCKRTLNIVEALSVNHSDRMRFYLSKADEAGHESDRQRVMMQIVQELCKRPGLNRTGFDMLTIYITNPNKTVRCVNQIDDVCKDIEKTINQTIQNTLNALEHDCDEIGLRVNKAIEEDNLARSYNLRASFKRFILYLFGGTLFLLFVMTVFPKSLLKKLFKKAYLEGIYLFMESLLSHADSLPERILVYLSIGLLSLSIALIFIAKFNSSKSVMTRKRKKLLLNKQHFVTNVVKSKKQNLYKEYLEQAVSDHDL